MTWKMARCCNCCPVLSGKRTKTIVLLLVGLDNAGKTTAARNLAGGTTEDVIATVGFSSIKLKHRGMDVVIYDLGGGPQIRAIWESYFSDVHGVIFVLDASDASRIEECKKSLENLLRNERLAGKPVLVLANKQDKPGALDQVDLVESLRLEPLVNEQKCLTLIEECSALNYSQRNKIDPRLLNGYRWLVNQISTEYETLNRRVEYDKKIAAESFAARRNELRQRLEGNKENGLETTNINGDSEKLPYKNNIIHVSPPPGVLVNSSPSQEEVSHEKQNGVTPAQNLTRQIKEQLEQQSMKERHRMSLRNKNKVNPVFYGIQSPSEPNMSPQDLRKERPRSEPKKLDPTNFITQNLENKRHSKHSLPPFKLSPRPFSSKSLGHEGRAWDLQEELEIVVPLSFRKGSDTSEVRAFNENESS